MDLHGVFCPFIWMNAPRPIAMLQVSARRAISNFNTGNRPISVTVSLYRNNLRHTMWISVGTPSLPTLGVRPDEKQRLGCLLGANYTSPLIRHYSLTTTLLQLVFPHTRWSGYQPV